MIDVDLYRGPRPADLVESALAAYRRLGDDQPASVGHFIVEWLTTRGVAVRPIVTDEVPDVVCEAVADVVAPDEIGAPDTATSELVHRVMRTAYAATVAHLANHPEHTR